MAVDAIGKSQFASWRVPNFSRTVECPPEVMEEIRAFACNEFLHHARAGQDAGGVLFGTRRDDLIRILTWRPIACENSRGSTLHLSLNDRMNLALQLEMARKNPDLKDLRPLGWFVSHPYGVALSDADRELYNGFFPESWQVTLVLQPQGAGRAQAAFFVRDASGKTSQEAQECFELGAPAVKVKVRTDPAPPEPAPAIPTTPPITASPISVPPVISAPITAPPVIAQPTVKIETAPPQVIATPPAPELPSPSPPEPPVGQPAVSAKVEIPPEPVPPVTAPPPEAKAAAKIDTAPEPKPQQAPKLGAAARKEPVKPAPPAAEVPGPTVSTPGTVPTSTAAPTPSVVPTPSFEIDDGPPARERWLWAIPIVLALSIAAVVLYQRKPAAGHSIGLRASNEAQTVQFVWDANSPAVRDAHRGELEVSDAGKS